MSFSDFPFLLSCGSAVKARLLSVVLPLPGTYRPNVCLLVSFLACLSVVRNSSQPLLIHYKSSCWCHGSSLISASHYLSHESMSPCDISMSSCDISCECSHTAYLFFFLYQMVSSNPESRWNVAVARSATYTTQPGVLFLVCAFKMGKDGYLWNLRVERVTFN